ncbi:MAG: spore germination protein, partial [Clostridiales bacterium]
MAVYIRKKANEDEKKKIFSDPARNIQILKQKLGDSMDVVIREFRLGNGQQAVAVYIDNLVSKEILGRDFFAPLMNAKKSGDWLLGEISQQVLKMGEIKELTSMEQLIAAILQGMTGLMIAGENAALIVEAVSWPQRSINEPATDVVIRGPREGFIESIRANVALLRRKIHHPDLQIEELMLGKYSQTTIGIIYVSSIVNRNVLRELKRRLKRIDIDGILDSGYIEQLIQDTPFSLFPTIGITEKPDIAAARILEGRVAVLIDGSPIALTVPMFFAEGLQSSEDYFTRFYYASWIRMIRVLAFLINIWLPGLFVAVVTWHQQIIPVRLFLSMAAAEANTPFAVGLAMLLILVAYEVLREAGVRLPKPAGQAIS